MKNIGILVFVVLFLNACKQEPTQDVLTEGEVMQTPAGLSEEADAMHDVLNKAADTLAKDFDKAEESVKNTVENIQNENTKLQENIDVNKSKATK